MFKKLGTLFVLSIFILGLTTSAFAAEVSVFVRQAVEGKRDIVSDDYSKGIEVGTAWVVVDNGKDAPFIAHFMPSKSLVKFTEGKILVNMGDIANRIYVGEEAKAQVESEPYHAQFKENISLAEANGVIDFIKSYSKPYNLIDRNCVDFVEEVVKECGIDTEELFKKNEMAAPLYFHELLRKQGIDVKRVYNSHAPGNLVEDWKELKDPRIRIIKNLSQ